MLLLTIGVLLACAELTYAGLIAAAKAPVSECRSLMDLVFVADGSDSIAAKDYQQQRIALASILKELDIGPDKARVGLVVYSSNIAQVVPLTGDAALLQKEAMELAHPRDGTKTDLGIAKMIELFKTGGRPNVPWTSIVITDGISKNPTETAAQAANAKNIDVNMYAVGISHFILRDELEAIASSPSQVLELTSFDQLRDSLSKIMKVVCPCPVPPKIPNAFVSDGGRAIGTQRTYTCAPGFQPMGNPVLECLKNAVWSPLDFSCQACPDPLPVYGNAELVPGTPQDVLVGVQREYLCNKGYTSPVPIFSTCQETPTGPIWTDPTSICTTCLEPHLPPFSQPNALVSTTLIGDAWIFDCMPGYVATGPMETVCVDKFGIPEWIAPIHSCITCTTPPELPFAAVDTTGTVLVGTVRKYACMDGYHPSGPIEATCIGEAGSTLWKVTPYECIACMDPPKIPHARLETPMNHLVGSVLVYSCLQGYQPTGPIEHACMANGGKTFWDGPLNGCVTCEAPPLLPNTILDPAGDVLVGSVRGYQCIEGFVPSGPIEVGCIEGVGAPLWTAPEYQCITCTKPPLFPNARMLDTGSNLVGAVREYECLPGFVPSVPGFVSIQCVGEYINNRGNVFWSEPSHACIACPEPPILEHSIPDAGDTLVGSTRSYICTDGFHATGPIVVTCMKNAQWSIPEHSCKACGPLPDVPNAFNLNGPSLIGTIRKYKCADGFVPDAEPIVRCQPDATWSPIGFTCTICKEAYPMGNAVLEPGSTMVGAVRAYTCLPGYLATGPIISTCASPGPYQLPDWSTPVHSCIDCGEPFQVPFATSLVGPRMIGSMQMYECDPGYVPSAPPNSHCMPNAKWTPPAFKCITCLEPPVMPNADVDKVGGILLGDIRTYKCMKGYIATGPIERICTVDLPHDYQTPFWKDITHNTCIDCGIPPPIPHGAWVEGPITIGTSAQFVCDKGFSADGPAEILCTETGEWSLPAFKCTGCFVPPVLPYADIVGYKDGDMLLVGESYNYACHAGFNSAVGVIVTCQDDLGWSAPSSTCGGCPAKLLPGAMYGTAISPPVNDSPVGLEVFYTCDKGYMHTNTPAVVCQDNLEWSMPLFQCVVTCFEPPQYDDATVDTVGGNLERNVRIYTCAPGLFTVGDTSIICEPSGQWSPRMFECRMCTGPPSDLLATAIKPGPRLLGETVEYQCAPGYKPTGDTFINCIDGAMWSPLVIGCANCMVPPKLHLATQSSLPLTDKGVLVGETVVYECLPGFVSDLPVSVSCQPDLSWSLPTDVCRGCDPHMVPLIDSGAVVNPPNDFSPIGHVLVYQCAKGFKPTSALESVCLDTTQWSIPAFHCARTCFEPPLFDDAIVATVGGVLEGDVRTYTCAPGLFRVGDTNIMCDTTGVWSPRLFECKMCVDPPTDLLAAAVSPGPRLLGETVDYQCVPGYSPTGKTFIKCLDGAMWSPLTIGCTNCMKPPKLHLAEPSVPFTANGVLIGETVTYNCLPGYVSIVPVGTTCQSDLSWSKPTDICRGCDPGIIPAVGNADILDVFKDFVSIGTKVTYQCAPNHIPSNAPETICMDNTQWSAPTFICEMSCGDPTVFKDSTVDLVGGILVGSERVYECNLGLQTVGNVVLTCLPNGHWSPREFDCKMCMGPPLVTNAITVNPGPRMLGEALEYQCKPGYVPTGDTMITCLIGATWSTPIIGCSACGLPPQLPYSGITMVIGDDDMLVGSSVSYTCDAGYKSIAPVTSTCQPDLTWSVATTFCRGCMKEDAPVIPHGIIAGQLDQMCSIGFRLTYTCEVGYMETDNPEVECMDDFTWMVPTFRCAVSCGQPPVHPDASVDFVGNIYEGSVRKYSCNSGMLTMGDNSITCMGTGLWTDLMMECKKCPPPPVLPYGVPLDQTSFIGTEVAYKCNKGTISKGPVISICQQNLSWSTPFNTCFDCGPTPDIPNAHVILGSSSIGAKREYECNANYEILNDADTTIKCLTTGQWSNPGFICSPKKYEKRRIKKFGYPIKWQEDMVVSKPVVTGIQKNHYGRRNRRKFRRGNRPFRRFNQRGPNFGMGLMVELDDLHIAPVFPMQPSNFGARPYPSRHPASFLPNLNSGFFMNAMDNSNSNSNSDYLGRSREVLSEFKSPIMAHNMGSLAKQHVAPTLWNPPSVNQWHKAPMKWYPSPLNWHKAPINWYPAAKQLYNAPNLWHNTDAKLYNSIRKKQNISSIEYPALTNWHYSPTTPFMWPSAILNEINSGVYLPPTFNYPGWMHHMGAL